MRNAWWKYAHEIEPCDIVALGGLEPGQPFPVIDFPCKKLRIGQSVNDWWMDVGDAEPKFMYPREVRQWTVWHQAAGLGWGMVYCSVGWVESVDSALGSIPYFRWVASLTEKEHAYPGATATQWGTTPNEHVQTSLVTDPHWLNLYR